MKPHHAAALALMGWYLMVPSGIHAQSQLNIPPPVVTVAPHSNNTLEIPVVVQPNQPPLDLTFVGTWCGYEYFRVYKSEPPIIPEPPGIRQGTSGCYAFTRSGNGGVVLVGDVTISPTFSRDVVTHVVSQSAYAVSAREIIATTIVEMTLPAAARSTTTVTYNFKLISPAHIVFSRTVRTAITTLDFVPFATTMGKFAGDQHPAAPGEAEAYQASLGRSVGGSDVAVPGAR